jgi:hypothetical protein
VSRLTHACVLAAAALVPAACALHKPCPTGPAPVRAGAYVVDGAGQPLEALEAGTSLVVGARALEPRRLYEFRLGLDGPAASRDQALSFARVGADARGDVPEFVLWFHSGVVGCSARLARDARLRPGSFRGVDEAERALRGRRLVLTVHAVEPDPSGRRPPLQLAVSEAISRVALPVVPSSAPSAYVSDAQGCLLNSLETGTGDVYVSGRHFAPGEELEVALVPNQRLWRVDDVVRDRTGRGGTSAPERVRADRRGAFTVRVWEREAQRRGEYDVVVRRRPEAQGVARVRAHDVVSYGIDTAFLLFLRYPPGGPTMDLAGRPLSGSPYFEFADAFAPASDPVWAAVDPTYVPDPHPGGTYAAYYVVAHRDVNGWDPAMGGSTNLVDLSGAIEIMPVKAGCVNGTDVVIWNPPLPLGDYDVVVDFGSTPAENAATYATDASYDAALDFLDGADQIGFVVAADPYDLGFFAIGQSSYSQDDFFPTLGTASAVDLRATVRYPASAAGVDTPVAAGTHPLFVIEHGNHRICEVCRDAGGNPVPCTTPGLPAGCAKYFTHAECPSRTPNHEGYTRLLEILASHGVIAVSIDAYDLTGPNCMISAWIPERGTLILKHLELWSHMHDASTYTSYPDFFAGRFAGKVDLTRVAVSGHSRGGEASVAAYLQNAASPTPFGIVGVSSIAPVDFHSYTLPSVPYFVILPAGDGDVSGLSGQRIYDRAGGTLTPLDGLDKSAVYVYGANHNFFNTVWAAHGDESDPTRDDYIAAADQQRLGEAYLSAFHRAHLLGTGVYKDVLRGRLTFPSTAGFKAYAIHHETSHGRVDSGSGTGSASGATAAAVTGFSPPHATQALRVTWNSGAGELLYTLPAALADVTPYEVFSFRAAQSDSTLNPAAGSQDFQVELLGGGKSKAVFSSRFFPIPRPYDHPYYTDDHNVMTTVRIPLHSFIMNKSGVPLGAIDSVKFRFLAPSQGEIYVDDIEFSR